MVTVPTLEYHNRNWTWTDMLMEVKKVYKQHIIQKVSLHHLKAKGLLVMCRELKLCLVWKKKMKLPSLLHCQCMCKTWIFEFKIIKFLLQWQYWSFPTFNGQKGLINSCQLCIYLLHMYDFVSYSMSRILLKLVENCLKNPTPNLHPQQPITQMVIFMAVAIRMGPYVHSKNLFVQGRMRTPKIYSYGPVWILWKIYLYGTSAIQVN